LARFFFNWLVAAVLLLDGRLASWPCRRSASCLEVGFDFAENSEGLPSDFVFATPVPEVLGLLATGFLTPVNGFEDG
jgi:hypothetical protein